nr:SIS domain-containing protein [bacterium]
MTLTQQEILQQFDALRDTVAVMKEAREGLVSTLAGKKLVLTGCGSSYTLCISAAWMLKLRGIDAWAVPAGDLIAQPALYENLMKGGALVSPSRSGKTSECLQAMEIARKLDMPVVSFVADGEAPLATGADFSVVLPFAFDHSVCQTRNVSCFFAAFSLMAAMLAGDDKLLGDMESAIADLPTVFEGAKGGIEAIAAKGGWRNVFVLADSVLAGLGQEAALAFCEIARLPGEHKHLLDVRHGPMVLAREDSVIIMVTPWEENPFLAALVKDFKSHGSTIILIAPKGQEALGEDLRIDIAAGRDMACAGLPMILTAQWLALSAALQRGYNPDQPEGLSAWIKL